MGGSVTARHCDAEVDKRERKGWWRWGTHRQMRQNFPNHSKDTPPPRFNYLICLFAFILIWPLMKMQFGKNLQVKSNYHFLGLIIKLSPPGTERDLTENSRTWLGRKEVHIQSPTRADRVG